MKKYLLIAEIEQDQNFLLLAEKIIESEKALSIGDTTESSTVVGIVPCNPNAKFPQMMLRRGARPEEILFHFPDPELDKIVLSPIILSKESFESDRKHLSDNGWDLKATRSWLPMVKLFKKQ